MSAKTLEIAHKLDAILGELQAQNKSGSEIWTKEDIASHFKISTDAAGRFVVKHKTFPSPLRLPTSENGGHPRWLSAEVKAWAKKFRARK